MFSPVVGDGVGGGDAAAAVAAAFLAIYDANVSMNWIAYVI